jgi:hypothetical protein
MFNTFIRGSIMTKEYLVILEIKEAPGRVTSRYKAYVQAQSDSEARRKAINEAESKGLSVIKQLACGRV